MIDLNRMTREQILDVPHLKWEEEKLCYGFVIVPSMPTRLQIITGLIKLFWQKKVIKKEFAYLEIEGVHDSSFRCMEFVALGKDHQPIFKFGGCSDVIHFDGIGGLGRWSPERGIPRLVPPSGWNIDCLLTSGLLRVFTHNGMILTGSSLSSMEVFVVPKGTVLGDSKLISTKEREMISE